MSGTVVWMLLSLGSGTQSITPIAYFSTQESCEQAKERISVALSHTATLQCVKATIVGA